MTNCIIHADLMLNGVLKVEKYDNKFVFTNPGLLRLPVEQIYAGEETRNHPETREKTREKIREKSSIGSEKTNSSSEKSSEKNAAGSEKNQAIIADIKLNPKVSAAEIAMKLGISSRAVEKRIKTLRENGIIRRIGSDKGGYWEVIENDTEQ